jgi:myo-inositol-1(or 4)-monophosphatase
MGAVEPPKSRTAAPLAGLETSDWTGFCRRAVAGQRQIFEEARGVEARSEYAGVGEGGDWALVIDRRCEDVVFAELEKLAAAGASFLAVSEERGEVTFGEGGSLRVVIDPIDGSLNARRTIPSHCLSIAVADGPGMADVGFGFVYDFGAGEEFVATAGGGATLDGRPIRALESENGLELVGIEAAKPELALPAIAALQGQVYRLRGIGSIAISLAYVAAGRLDGMLGLRPCRSVDAAAGQLIAREAGAHVRFDGTDLGQADLGIEARYPIAAAAAPGALEKLIAAQRQVGSDE